MCFTLQSKTVVDFDLHLLRGETHPWDTPSVNGGWNCIEQGGERDFLKGLSYAALQN